MSGIDSSRGLSAVLAAVYAARKGEAGAASSRAFAQNGAVAKKTDGSAPSGAKPSSSAGRSASTSESDTYDDTDTNKDGVVTVLEQVTYDMKHTGEQSGGNLDVKA